MAYCLTQGLSLTTIPEAARAGCSISDTSRAGHPRRSVQGSPRRLDRFGYEGYREHMLQSIWISSPLDGRRRRHVAADLSFRRSQHIGGLRGTQSRFIFGLIREGLKAHGIDDLFLEPLARGKTPPYAVDHLFVYSTFMTGGPRHGSPHRWVDLSSRTDAAVHGLLYDSGKGFPCMVPRPNGAASRKSELFILKDFKKSLRTTGLYRNDQPASDDEHLFPPGNRQGDEAGWHELPGLVLSGGFKR